MTTRHAVHDPAARSHSPIVKHRLGRKTWRIPVKGGLVANDGLILNDWAEQGLGLGYVFEPLVAEQLRNGTLRHVLEPYSANVPGFYLFYPSRSQRSPPLQVFIATLLELLAQEAASAKKRGR